MDRLLLRGLLAVTLLGATAAELTGQDASVYVVHGIPGTDLGLAADLPVDITSNGTCLLTNVPFGTIAGPLAFAPGRYLIEVRPADLVNPCSQPPLVANTFDWSASVSYAAVAHLDAAGAAALSSFIEDLSPVRAGNSRATLHHLAYAPPGDVELHRKMTSEMEFVPGVANGDQVGTELPFGVWRLTLYPAGSSNSIYGPVGLNLQQRTAYMIFAVGSFLNDTFTVLSKPVRVGRN